MKNGINMIKKLWARLFMHLGRKGWFKWMPDKMYLKIAFKLCTGYALNLDDPRTLNEKLQWIKLYDRREEYSVIVDKYRVREYVREKVGEKYLIPLLGVWDSVEDIDFDALPNKFVLKCTHDSGSVVFCENKESFDVKSAKKKLAKCMKKGSFQYGREWAYTTVTPRIIAEEYLEDKDHNDLIDYKLHTFDGKARILTIITNRKTNKAVNHFHIDGDEVKPCDFIWGASPAEKMPEPPKNIQEMKKLSEILAEGFPELRCDFYEVDGKTFFGELTLFHGSGFLRFNDVSWAEEIGSWMTLPDR